MLPPNAQMEIWSYQVAHLYHWLEECRRRHYEQRPDGTWSWSGVRAPSAEDQAMFDTCLEHIYLMASE